VGKFMNRAEKISLISIEYTQDDIGQWLEERTETDVFALVESVTMSEFYQAGMQGFKPEYRMTVWMNEYGGQKLLEYAGLTYTIYRTFRRDDGRIELYVTERKGDEDDTE